MKSFVWSPPAGFSWIFSRPIPSVMPIFLIVIFMITISCVNEEGKVPSITPVDPDATTETRALLKNLEKIRHDHILFGHQDAMAYGVTWRDEENRSDVKDITGSHPALYGWDLGHIEIEAEKNLDEVLFQDIRNWIIEAYERGGVITLSWHLNNPATVDELPEEHDPDEWEATGSSWDTTPVIEEILPGGEYEEVYNDWLDKLAAFINTLTSEGASIPIIFRPFHEVTGHWFWWSAQVATPEEYIALWQYTVEALRDERGLHNLLYAYTPNTLNEMDSWDEFLKWYPGDDYVDIIGFDDYYTLQGGYGDDQPVEKFSEMLSWLVNEAEKRDKVPVIGETGLEAVAIDDWYTNLLLEAIKSNPEAGRLAYVLAWRNANEETDRKDHFYVPYPGHPAESDFLKFTEDPMILLENDLPDMYTSP